MCCIGRLGTGIVMGWGIPEPGSLGGLGERPLWANPVLGLQKFGLVPVQPGEDGQRGWAHCSARLRADYLCAEMLVGPGNGLGRASRKMIRVIGGCKVQEGFLQKSRRKLAECELFVQIWPRLGRNMQKESTGWGWDEKGTCFLSSPQKSWR